MAYRLNYKASYLGAVEAIDRSGCRKLGLIQSWDSWDYPFFALAWERGFAPEIRQIRAGDSLDDYCAVILVDQPDTKIRGREIYRAEPIVVFTTGKPD